MGPYCRAQEPRWVWIFVSENSLQPERLVLGVSESVFKMLIVLSGCPLHLIVLSKGVRYGCRNGWSLYAYTVWISHRGICFNSSQGLNTEKYFVHHQGQYCTTLKEGLWTPAATSLRLQHNAPVLAGRARTGEGSAWLHRICGWDQFLIMDRLADKSRKKSILRRKEYLCTSMDPRGCIMQVQTYEWVLWGFGKTV